MSGGNADCVLALPEDYTTKYGFQFSQFSPIAEVEEEEPSVNDKNQDEQSLIVKKKQLLLSHQKANLYIPLSKSQTPPVKHPKPTAKQREANRQQQQQRHQQQQNQQQQQQQQQQSQQPLSPKSQKSPLSPVRSPPATRPVQPVFPLPDRRPGEEGASPPVQDAAVHMQHYKVHQSSRSPNSGSPNGRAHMLISSPSSSVEHSPNSDNNSGTSTPMYSERSSPSGSSCNTSTGVHNKSYVRPSIAVMQHSYTADPSKRGTDITKVYSFTEPMDGINLSQCSNSSRDSNSSSRSKREIRSPESQKPKFPSPEGQYSMDGQFRSTDMPTAVVRHHATGVHKQRQNRDEQDMYTRLHPKGLSGYISDGGMSVTSSIEELSAINQTSDYTDLSTQPNVVIVKPQPVAGTAYYHQTGFKDHMQSTNDHKQQSRGGIPPPNQGVISPPNSKQGNSSYSYHTQPQFSTKGFPPSHHGQFKQSYPPTQTVSASPHWATQRQGPPSNNYSKQGKPIEYIKTASPPGVKEGKARSYLVADGTDYSNEMIAAYRAHEAAVNGDFMYLYRVVSSGEIPPTLADHHKSTLIHKSALNGHLKCLSFLVKNSHPDAINLLDDNLLTPVLLSIQGGHLDCVRWLVDETNVEMVVPDAGGETLLHHAAFHGKVNILEWLIEKIKSRGEQLPDIVDDSGVTPAHFAAQQGHLDCLQLLYDKGCSLTFADHDNQRPMDWADASNQMLCSHYLLIVETCWQLSNDVAMLKQQLMKVQTENQSLKDIIGGMEKEHNKNMSKIQLQYEAKIEKIRENYVDLTAKLIQDVKENQQGTGKLPTSRTMSDSTNAHYHFQQADVDKAKVPKDTDYDANISGLAQEVLRKRQSTVAQRMLENREVRRRQPVLAGRASPLSPSLHRMEQFNTENEMTKSHQPHQKKAGGRVVTFAPHVEEFPKSPSPNYTVDHALHTLTEEPPIQPDQRYHENTD